MPRALAFAIVLVVLAVGGWLAQGTPSATLASETETTAASHDWGFSFSSTAHASEATDAGALPSISDGAVEPSRTGALAHEITHRLCPESTRLLCAARERARCDGFVPWLDDETDTDDALPCAIAREISCATWVERNYGGADDRLVVSENALALCLGTLREDLRGGESITMSGACNELARDAANEGEACAMEWYPCGRDGRCSDGVCVANGSLGAPCVDTPCGSGLACVAGLCERPTRHGARCDDDSTCAEPSDYCIDGVCASHIADGGACEYDEACEISSRCAMGRCTHVSVTSCSLAGECGHGRVCSGELEPRCELEIDAGRACVSVSDCGGLYCVDGRCAGSMTVAPGVLREGERCTFAADEQCSAGLSCETAVDGYRCVLPTTLGARCDEGQRCGPGAACIWRVIHGACEPALCDMQDYFVESGEE